MRSFFRLEEYKVLLYRVGLVYLFYFIARILFYIYNANIVEVDSIGEFLKIAYHGLAFDTTAILYINGLFILLSIFPFFVNTKAGYQNFLFWLYFITNLVFYALNFIDFIYYKYNFSRLTLAAWDIIKHEEGKVSMLFRFLITYWHVFILYVLIASLWIFFYKKVKIKHNLREDSKVKYIVKSIIGVLIITTLCVGGIRGDFKKSTRPINLVDANRHVKKIKQADLVLNSPFTFLRTIRVKSFKKQDFNIAQNVIEENFKPIKFYHSNSPSKPNIVLIITESMGREYIGAFNKNAGIKDYVSYTPFLDSLAKHSMIFTNAYSNGYKSIHGMSSIISGIPSFKDAFTSSPFAQQKIESMVSCLNSKGYDTSFFHGAPNGSMGFLGYSNILGFDHYYGKTEYGNDADFDGSWGIWDEPFLQFMNATLSKKQQPFFGTVFTVTSHEPYVIPKKFEGKFPKGNVQMHQCVGYTDYAFKKFFESAKKEPWFSNTIFIITADHCNQVSYKEHFYDNIMNRNAIPILIYKPNSDFVGESNEIAQHIDIYPTLMDMIGYDKPFRSWGRSLLTSENDIEPYLINFNSNIYYFMKDGYICLFDGTNAIGFYKVEDVTLSNNLINQRNETMNSLELQCKAFIQDYFDRILDKNLTTQK
ncbi:MAG: sulfatase [Flavobacterium sp.]|uniref:LTA synthase family protein n=1 Tax=Flavobacterium sp. TaxID=239 RepID=UPI000C649381|nr:alkaline phosphatase family protein [Flavobacterium sp.]MBF04379.1 sulfatase [Flavobacterium sp.]